MGYVERPSPDSDEPPLELPGELSLSVTCLRLDVGGGALEEP